MNIESFLCFIMAFHIGPSIFIIAVVLKKILRSDGNLVLPLSNKHYTCFKKKQALHLSEFIARSENIEKLLRTSLLTLIDLGLVLEKIVFL